MRLNLINAIPDIDKMFRNGDNTHNMEFAVLIGDCGPGINPMILLLIEMRSPPVFWVGSVFLIFLVSYIILLCVFTFLVLCLQRFPHTNDVCSVGLDLKILVAGRQRGPPKSTTLSFNFYNK
jgi:hypothetical protein